VQSDTTKLGSSPSRLGATLAAAHLLCVILVYAQHYEGSWGYVLFALPDLPVMLVLGLINKLVVVAPTVSWILIGVFGTIWWYMLGIWVSRVFRTRA
jgi:hypothetical protein